MGHQSENFVKHPITAEEICKLPVILVFVRYYLPGFKSGGPVRSIANMVSLLGREYDFRIVALNRDFMDKRPYPGIPLDEWHQMGFAKVWYFGGKVSSFPRMIQSIRGLGRCMLYLNSLFDPLFTLLPLVAASLRVIRPVKILIAVRGELSPGALELKEWRKAVFLRFSRLTGLYSKVYWHASTTMERNDIIRNFQVTLSVYNNSEGITSSSNHITVASNVYIASDLVDFNPGFSNRNDSNSIIFISRITRKKNLDFALNALALCKSNVTFNIYGTMEDKDYWTECEKIIGLLPANVKAVFCGQLKHDEISPTLKRHALLFFPTRGENYGHVIAESLAAGLPVLLSDQTPWSDVEENGAGWIRPLTSLQGFADVIDAFTGFNQELRSALADSVNAYAHKRLGQAEDIDNNRRLLSLEKEDSSMTNQVRTLR